MFNQSLDYLLSICFVVPVVPGGCSASRRLVLRCSVERMSVCTTDGAEPTRMDGNEVQRGKQEGGVWEMRRRVQEVGWSERRDTREGSGQDG